MQIKNDYKINNSGYYTKISNNNTSFQGIHARAYIKEIFPKNQDKLWADCYDFGAKLGISERKVKVLLEKVSPKRHNFMGHLADYYNFRNYYTKGSLKENPQNIIDIFKAVKKVTPEHTTLLHYSNMPVETLKELFAAAKDKESLNFAVFIQKDVLDGGKATALKIIDMLNSPYRNNYIKDFNSYKSYIKLNIENENAIKNLDKLISNGEYQSKTYDAKLAVKEFLGYSNIKEGIAPFADELEKNYSKFGKRFINKISGSFLAYRKGLSKQDYGHIVDMYSTTNSNNINLRINLIDKFKHSLTTRDSKTSDIEELKILFNRIDTDSNIASFVDKALGYDINVKTIREMNVLLDNVPPKKAEIFHKNISRIVEYTEPEERITALKKDIENPFFITPKYSSQIEQSIKAGYTRPESKWQKFKTDLENKINIFRYKKYLKTHQDIIKPTVRESEIKPQIITEPVVTPQKQTVNNTYLPVKFVKRPKELPAFKKLKVKISVNDIIEQKLGAKTLSKQRAEYAQNATAMRLKLLPEIFGSISEARSQQRAAGIRPNIESRDALKLYKNISGKNRKLIRYMLKQTNENNNRIFSIRDINSIISNAEKEIAQNKKADKNYKAADAKALYEDIYQSVISEHGKLRRTNTKQSISHH